MGSELRLKTPERRTVKCVIALTGTKTLHFAQDRAGSSDRRILDVLFVNCILNNLFVPYNVSYGYMKRRG